MVNPRDCNHKNIHWEDLFKENKVKDDGGVNSNFQWHDAYCLDCGEVKGKKFAYSLQNYYCKKVEEWLKDNGLTEKKTSDRGEEFYFIFDFTKFLKKNNYEQFWNKLQLGKIDEQYFDAFGGQMIFWEASIWTEKLCREFKKEKDQQKPDNPNDQERERERERERAGLQRKIKRLENKSTRTPQEEQELTNLRKKLSELEKNNQENNNNSWLKPTLIIGGIVIVVIGLIWLVSSKKNSRKH